MSALDFFAHGIVDYALGFGFVAFSLALLLNLVRLFSGPTMMDRVLAVDTMVINVIALIMLFDAGVFRGGAAVRHVRFRVHRGLLPLHAA
jgi:hypothetical protein